MIFKVNWEKTDKNITLPRETIESIVQIAFPQQRLSSYELISEGCANLNYKIQHSASSEFYILRIYLRDDKAAQREQQLATLLKPKIPIPTVEFVGKYQGFSFAITEYLSGITLRELLLTEKCDIAKGILIELGRLLAQMQDFQFPSSGFFDTNLQILSPLTSQAYLSFYKSCLEHQNTQHVLGHETISKLQKSLDLYATLLPDAREHSLVHGDFSPENILVSKIDGVWKLFAILDWEFAFSGSGLTDVANMLRYSHEMPDIYEESFLKGLGQGGYKLPQNWRKQIYFL